MARIRVQRRIVRVHRVRDWLDLVLWCLLSAIAFAGVVGLGYWAVQTYGKDAFKEHPMFVALAMLGGLGWGVVLLCLLALGIAMLFVGLGSPLAPIRTLFDRLRDRREAGQRLLDLEIHGELHASDTVSKRALAKLADQDRDLEFDAKTGRLTPITATQPESCPTCRADLEHPAPGIRRCDYCDFERFDDLTGISEDLLGARRRIGAVAEGESFTGSRAELWQRFKEKHSIEETGMFLGMMVGALVFGGLGEVGGASNVNALLVAGRIGAFFIGFGGGLMLPVALYRLYKRRFREFQPGVRAYDCALAADMISTLAQQGRMPAEDLAKHLGISRTHLGAVLGMLASGGHPPLYHDVARDTLISLHAVAIDNAPCPACGGSLEVGAMAHIECAHCGARSLGGGV